MGSLENPEKRITNPEQPKPYKPLSRGDFLAKFGELPKTPIETNEKSAKIFSELTQAYLHTAVSGDEQRHRLLTTSVIIDNLKTAVLKRKPDKL
ncbi:MAG TPA: hypothetical protein VE090_00255, partial [Methylomirabilota bacterium]|nr:hypothetical protein [Methylomirabilota bacterium]